MGCIELKLDDLYGSHVFTKNGLRTRAHRAQIDMVGVLNFAIDMYDYVVERV